MQRYRGFEFDVDFFFFFFFKRARHALHREKITRLHKGPQDAHRFNMGQLCPHNSKKPITIQYAESPRLDGDGEAKNGQRVAA